jgi:hypothetical protein
MLKTFLTISLIVLANFSYAGSVSGYVKGVRIDRDGKGMVEFDQVIATPPDCAAAPYMSHFSFDTKTEGGRAIYSMVLAAAASGKKIVAYGLSSCQEYTNVVESWSYGHFYKD